MGQFQEDWNNNEYEIEYERTQDEKKRRLDNRKRHNIIKLVGVCAAGLLILFACFSVLMSLDKKMPTIPVIPNSSSEDSAVTNPDSAVLPDVSAIPVPPGALAADPAAWNLLLINAANPVDAGFAKPATQNVIQDNTVYLFDGRIVDALEQMRKDCNANVEGSLVITSGYMGFGYLEKLYNYYYEQYIIQGLGEEKAREAALKMADPPGVSDNHTGLAVHFTTSGGEALSPSFAGSAQYSWLITNAENYGFVLRYAEGKEAVTGVAYRPWHFRYVGVEEAKAMNAAGVCLEEYVGKV